MMKIIGKGVGNKPRDNSNLSNQAKPLKGLRKQRVTGRRRGGRSILLLLLLVVVMLLPMGLLL